MFNVIIIKPDQMKIENYSHLSGWINLHVLFFVEFYKLLHEGKSPKLD